jgi:hypothetical protein
MTGTAFGFRLGLLAAFVLVLLPRNAGAHCDTLDGPVVATARAALQKGDVTPVLKWVRSANEPEIRAAFARTLAVRSKGPEARGLADTYFFETLVRLHRAGEGAPYTGLKPAASDLGPAVAGADESLETGSVEALVKLVTGDVAAGIRQRFARASETRKHMDESVEAGREYVEAYVEYVHHVERIHAAASEGAHHGNPEAAVQHHAQ